VAQIIVSMRCKTTFGKPSRNAPLFVNEAWKIDVESGKGLALLENAYLAGIADTPKES
jgi:hypothetical protein